MVFYLWNTPRYVAGMVTMLWRLLLTLPPTLAPILYCNQVYQKNVKDMMHLACAMILCTPVGSLDPWRRSHSWVGKEGGICYHYRVWCMRQVIVNMYLTPAKGA